MKLNFFNLTLLANYFSKLPIKLLIPKKITAAKYKAMLLQSENVSEMHFPVNREPKFRVSELNKQ